MAACAKAAPGLLICMDQRWDKRFWAAIFVLLFAARLCHSGILWADEDYHQAAAIQLLHGKMLYRDVWYDKPPANALAFLLFGAQGGWVLRLASALYALLVCALAFRFASSIWSRKEGYWAAALFAFFLTFYFPGASITLEPDTLLLAPHLAAVYLAWRRRPFAAGIAAGVAMWFNVKALYVLAACALFGVRTWPLVGLGFLIPTLLQAGWLAWTGAWTAYIEQIWRWGLLYTAATSGVDTGWVRLRNWAGFHAALVIGAAWFFRERGQAKGWWYAWCGLSLVATSMGTRFVPHYMNQLLPPLVLVASRGWVILTSRGETATVVRAAPARIAAALLAVTLAVPALRFGPRYLILAKDQLTGAEHRWKDIGMDQDSRAAARIIRAVAKPNDTIFIWGYRPDIIGYTRLPLASRFWDSQQLSGVLANWHLAKQDAIAAPEWAARNRAEFVHTQPTFVADGLSLYNPRLDMRSFPDLAEWLKQYREVGRTAGTIVYRRCMPDAGESGAPSR